MVTLEAPDLQAIRTASERVAPYVVRTPLLPLNVEQAGPEIFLKPEIRLLFERHCLIAEGAGAAPVAAALAGRAGGGKIVCVISGGNLDECHLLEILAGRTPAAASGP